MMYNIHHETHAALSAGKYLEDFAYSLAAAGYINLGAGASSRSRKIWQFARRPQRSHGGARWSSEESPRFARYRNLSTWASQRKAPAENLFLISVLIDSDILLEVSRARDDTLIARWSQLSREETPLLCSPVTVAELWHGARPSEQSALNALFGAIECVTIDTKIGQRAGDYLRQYFKSHHLELGDALIAATASVHNFRLWTRNRRHYPMKDIAFY
jgi:predicted nucleic acid-binding protein